MTKTATKPTTTTTTKSIPEGFHTITPTFMCKDASKAIEFYKKALGATLVMNMPCQETGKVMHAELAVGPARFMLTEEQPQYGALSPKTLGGSASTAIVHVPNVDSVFERAVSSGSTVTMPLADQFWGDRSGAVTDPFGHKWMIATHIEDPSPDEIKRRVQKMFESGAPC